MAQKFPTEFSRIFSQKIWRLHIDPYKEWLAIELRDADSLEVSFYIEEIATQKIIERNLFFEQEPWEISLSEIENGQAVFIVYHPNSQLPHIEKVFIWDVLKQQVIPALTLEGYQEQQKTMQAVKEELQRASQYKQGGEYFETVCTFLQKKYPEALVYTPQKAIDYLETNTCIVIGYYLFDQRKLSYWLLITDLKGKELYHAQVLKNLEAVGSDIFFVWKNWLFFVKNTNELVTFRIE